jgi:hypothetical protein
MQSSYSMQAVYGVDFSGAKLAGRNIWIARCAVGRNRRLRLEALHSLETLCGTPDRQPALSALVGMIKDSTDALWGIDAPFGVPIEVVDAGHTWADQLALVTGWTSDAYDLGLSFVARARALGDAMHIRRTTDTEARTPFDCYHYRIIYQTFHAMRDVLAPLTTTRGTAILPFQYARLNAAKRVVVEACPGSTLKRLNLPHNNYKQPTGGPLTRKRRMTRHRILDGLHDLIDLKDSDTRTMMRNPGGDALDAVIAAVGAYWAWTTADHAAIRRHRRYKLEGRLYC